MRHLVSSLEQQSRVSSSVSLTPANNLTPVMANREETVGTSNCAPQRPSRLAARRGVESLEGDNSHRLVNLGCITSLAWAERDDIEAETEPPNP